MLGIIQQHSQDPTTPYDVEEHARVLDVLLRFMYREVPDLHFIEISLICQIERAVSKYDVGGARHIFQERIQ